MVIIMTMNDLNLRGVLEESAYTVKTMSLIYGVPESTLYSWKRGESFPNKGNKEKAEKIMSELSKTKKLQKHPSYGFATEVQIARLKEIGVGPEMDRILKQIAVQTKNKGKI